MTGSRSGLLSPFPPLPPKRFHPNPEPQLKDLPSPYPQHLTVSVLVIFTNLPGVKSHLTVLICISLTTSEVNNLFVNFLVIWVSLPMNYLLYPTIPLRKGIREKFAFFPLRFVRAWSWVQTQGQLLSSTTTTHLPYSPALPSAGHHTLNLLLQPPRSMSPSLGHIPGRAWVWNQGISALDEDLERLE